MEVEAAIGVFIFASTLLFMLPDTALTDFKNALPPEPPLLFVDEDAALLDEDAGVVFVAAAGGSTAAAAAAAAATLEAAVDTRPGLAIAAVDVDILPVKLALAPSSSGEEPERAFLPSSLSLSDGFGRLGIFWWKIGRWSPGALR